MSVFNPGMSVCKIKTYFHWEKRSNFCRLFIAFFIFKNIFAVALVTSFTHGFYCVQKIWSVASSFPVQTSLLNDFSVYSGFLSAAKLLFQDLLSSSSGHHLQKPSNALSLKRSGFLHLSFMNSAGCATSLPWGSCRSSAPNALLRAVSAGCR